MNKEKAELIERLRRGDKDSFDLLYREYSEKLYKYIFRFVKNHHDAEDLLEETFLKVIENIGELKFAAAFDLWIHKTAKNTALHFLEKKENSSAVKPDCEFDDLADIPDGSVPLPEDYAVRKDIADEVNAAVNGLSPEQRETVYLKYYKNRSIAEIAKIMNVSEGTVKTRLALAKKHLMHRLERLRDDGTAFVLVPIGSLLGAAKKPASAAARPAFVLKPVCAILCAGIAVAGVSAFFDPDSDIRDENFGDYRNNSSISAQSSDSDSGIVSDAGVFHEVDMRLKAKIGTGILTFLPEPDASLPRYFDDKGVPIIEGTTFRARGYIVDENGETWYKVARENMLLAGRSESECTGWLRGADLEEATEDDAVFPPGI